jgi:hypothetical protein
MSAIRAIGASMRQTAAAFNTRGIPTMRSGVYLETALEVARGSLD